MIKIVIINIYVYYLSFIIIIIFRVLLLLEKNQYLPSMIYNMDETSLLIKYPIPPTVLCNSSKFRPVLPKPDLIFSSTCVFIVDASGGSCTSTLILNNS
jgi:hypothetical protein